MTRILAPYIRSRRSRTASRLGHAGSLLAAAALFAAEPVESQCVAPPRILAPETVCTVGEPCDLTILLEHGGEDVASVATTVAVAASVDCSSPCRVGSQAQNAGCVINPGECRLNVVDIVAPITAFGEGEIAVATLVCNDSGEHALDLVSVSMGDPAGLPVAGCGASSTLTCEPVDLCEGAACDDGDPCTDDACDAGTGECVFSPLADGTACDDGDECTFEDVCDGGVCGGSARCGAPVTLALPPTVTDAFFALLASVDLAQCPSCLCDTDADGEITPTDVLRIVRASVGLAVALECPAA